MSWQFLGVQPLTCHRDAERDIEVVTGISTLLEACDGSQAVACLCPGPVRSGRRFRGRPILDEAPY